MLSKVTQNLIQPISDSVAELTVVASNAQVHKTPIPNLTAVSTPVSDNVKNLVVAARKTLEHSIIQSKSFLRGTLEVEHENKIKDLIPKIDAIGVKANQAGNDLVTNCAQLALKPLDPEHINGLVECLKTILLSTKDLLNIWDESEVLRILSVSKSLRERIQVLRSSDFNVFVKQPQQLLEVTKPVYQLAVMLIQLTKTRANELLNPLVAQFLESKTQSLSNISPLVIAVSKCMFEYVQVVSAMNNFKADMTLQLNTHCDSVYQTCLDIEAALVAMELPGNLIPSFKSQLVDYHASISAAQDACQSVLQSALNKQSCSTEKLIPLLSQVMTSSAPYQAYYSKPLPLHLLQQQSDLLRDAKEPLTIAQSCHAVQSTLQMLLQAHSNNMQQSLKFNTPLPLLLNHLSHKLSTEKCQSDLLQVACTAEQLVLHDKIHTMNNDMLQHYSTALGADFTKQSQLTQHESLVQKNNQSLNSTVKDQLNSLVDQQGTSDTVEEVNPLVSGVAHAELLQLALKQHSTPELLRLLPLLKSNPKDAQLLHELGVELAQLALEGKISQFVPLQHLMTYLETHPKSIGPYTLENVNKALKQQGLPAITSLDQLKQVKANKRHDQPILHRFSAFNEKDPKDRQSLIDQCKELEMVYPIKPILAALQQGASLEEIKLLLSHLPITLLTPLATSLLQYSTCVHDHSHGLATDAQLQAKLNSLLSEPEMTDKLRQLINNKDLVGALQYCKDNNLLLAIEMSPLINELNQIKKECSMADQLQLNECMLLLQQGRVQEGNGLFQIMKKSLKQPQFQQMDLLFQGMGVLAPNTSVLQLVEQLGRLLQDTKSKAAIPTTHVSVAPISKPAEDANLNLMEMITINEDAPLPVTEQELQKNPIEAIAKDLFIQTRRWVADGNEIVVAAMRVSEILTQLSQTTTLTVISPEQRLHLLEQSKALIGQSDALVKHAMALAQVCPDKRLKDQVLKSCERVPTTAQQLRILINVLMASTGQKNNNQVISSASNLTEAVGNVLWSCESAFVKVGKHYTVDSPLSKYSSFKVAKYKNGIVNKEYNSPVMKSKFLQELRALK